jgi:hypothetical protein
VHFEDLKCDIEYDVIGRYRCLKEVMMMPPMCRARPTLITLVVGVRPSIIGNIFQMAVISSGVATSSVGEYTTVYNPDQRYKMLSLADRVAVACCARFGVYRQHGVQIHRESTKLVCDESWMQLATLRSAATWAQS